MKKVLLVFLVSLLVASAIPTSGAAAEPAERYLYLLPDTGDGKNFTTVAPEAGDAILVEPHVVVVPRFMWLWTLDQSPEEWRLSPDDRLEATIHLEGLDRVVPLSEPRQDPAEMGRIKVQVDIFIAGSATTDTGLIQYMIDPSSNGNATGSVILEPQLLGTGLEAVTVQLKAVDTFRVATNWAFTVRVSVSGVTQADDRPRMEVAGNESASRILVSDFPWEAFREQETKDRDRRACNEKILQKIACERPEPVNETADPTNTTAPTSDAREAPVTPILSVLLLIVVAVSRELGRRKRR